MTDFYMVCIKRDFTGKLKYGQHYYDFDDGTMTFIAPHQVISGINEDQVLNGSFILFHPDFIQHYPLAKSIKNCRFFNYEANEALHLSEKEDKMIRNIMETIQEEYSSAVDVYSQDVIVSHLELLMNYSKRFYKRQFITRHHANKGILSDLENLLQKWFVSEHIAQSGFPTVRDVAENLNMSPNYLSDMLRNLTGQTTQQHIHEKLIESAKEKLSTTELSVSEIAYELGFEYAQSFSKLFKRKTNQTPMEFRQSFASN